MCPRSGCTNRATHSWSGDGGREVRGCYLHAPDDAMPLDSVAGARARTTVVLEADLVASAASWLDQCAAFFTGDPRAPWGDELGAVASALRTAMRASPAAHPVRGSTESKISARGVASASDPSLRYEHVFDSNE